MDLTQIPDPYKALGVARDADQAFIKSTYRKLALKCHPDKVTDASLKQQKQEEFHKIQQAYEIIGDEAKRERYDDAVKLEALQREKLSRNRAAADARPTARYDTRTQAPAGSHRYEEHKSSSRSYDDRSDRYYDERTRKYDTYEAYPKHTSPRSSREKDIPIKVTTRSSADRTRSDHKKPRDHKRYVSVENESSADEFTHFEAEYRHRGEAARKQSEDADFAKTAAEFRRKTGDRDRRSYEDSKYDRHDRHDRHDEDSKYDRYDRHDRQHKLKEQETNILQYIQRSKIESEGRPSPSRTTSSRDVRPEYYADSRSRREPRRSSAVRSPKERLTSSSGRERDRQGPQIVEWEKMPSFKQSSSSPAEIHLPSRTVPSRSYTESSRDARDVRHPTEASPPPVFRRSETMPSYSSSRRKEATSSTAYASVPAASPGTTRKLYSYTPAGGVREETSGHHTVLHEPSRFRDRSPPPISRPPIGVHRPVEISPNHVSTSTSKTAKPSLGRSATVNVGALPTEERGRRLYGEIGSEALKRENARRQTSFSPDQVSYSNKYGPEDVRWSPRSREQPTLSRHPTSVY